MSIRTKIGQLTGEDLARWRNLQARDSAIQSNGAAYSKEELERHSLELFRFRGEMIERFEIDDAKDWGCSAWGGLIFYED